MYTTKEGLAREFGLDRRTVYKRVEGIKDEIDRGRYHAYAISGRQINKAVFLDFNKFHQELENPALREHVPPFDMATAVEYLGGE